MLVVEESSSKTALGIIVHFFGANLKLDYLFIWRDNCGVQGLVTILLWHGNVIFHATIHWREEGMDNTEHEITGGSIGDNEAQGNNIVNTVDVLIVFGEFFMQRVNRFYATVATVGDTFFFERMLNGLTGVLEFFVGLSEAFGGEVFEIFKTFWIDVTEGSFLDFNTNATHLKTVGKWRKNFERFASDFLLFFWRKRSESTEVV